VRSAEEWRADWRTGQGGEDLAWSLDDVQCFEPTPSPNLPAARSLLNTQDSSLFSLIAKIHTARRGNANQNH
jgi:hypothetical protein